jgi:CxxC motif-containing protein (DUF1111 family)
MHPRRSPTRFVCSCLILIGLLVVIASVPKAAFQATDPGPRAGAPGAGGPLPGLAGSALQLFLAGRDAIQEVDSVRGTIPDTGSGLGPRFNMDSCGGCHNFPAPGGSSPPINPLVAVATKQGATNSVPSFIAIDGPIRRAFVKHTQGGNVAGSAPHLYSIAGRSDAPGCALAQPDFDALSATDNLAFHVPLPLYGDGLVDAIDTNTILANLASSVGVKRLLGIAGHAGGSAGQGRLLWKGQGTNLFITAAGAYQGEVGVTNSIASAENDQTPGCQFNPVPEDRFDLNATNFIDGLPDFVKIAGFVTFSAPPLPVPDTASIVRGRTLFAQIGCALCHTPSLQIGAAVGSAPSGSSVQLYSDLALHRMGPALADGIASGSAGPDEFRTMPLWGVGQRIFLLHDGRTRDLLAAIAAHASTGNGTSPASEANAVIAIFNALLETQKQDVVNFLRGL